jgi:sporulation protein YlmC with PRC-barrel domain
MRLCELLNRRVVTESGRELGRVHDIRAELTAGRLRVTGLTVGKLGILERYGIGTRGSGGAGPARVHGHPTIPWQHVVSVGRQVIVRDDPARI